MNFSTMKRVLQRLLLLVCATGFSAFTWHPNTMVAPVVTGSIINNTTGTQATLRVNSDQAGTVYYVIGGSDTNPTAAEVLAGQLGGGGAPLFSGNFAVTAATNFDQVLASLIVGTAYTVNFISRNAGNEDSAVGEVAFTATDSTAPTFTSSSIINNTLGTEFTHRAVVNENSTVYVVVTTSATVPSAAQIFAGNDHTGSSAIVASNSSATATVNLDQLLTGLTEGTAYHIYAVARDAAFNFSTVNSLTATATDSTTPTINSHTLVSVTSTSFIDRVNSSEDGVVYYVVTTSNTTPSIAQVVAGNDHTGAAAFKSGSAAATAGVDLDQTITGLTVNTTYYSYIVIEDGAGNRTAVDQESATTLCVPVIVSNLKVSDTNTTATLYWTDPGCFDEILVVARANTPATGSPSGNGSAYTANLDFTSGSSSSFGGGKVVFKGASQPAGRTVTNLTAGTLYYFTLFTRKGTNWSSGTAISTYTGAPGISSLTPADNATGVSTNSTFVIEFTEKVFVSTTSASGSEDNIVFDNSGADPSITRASTGDGSFVISGTTASITLNSDLDVSTVYNILIGNKMFADSTGNDFGGTSAGNWNFTTASGILFTPPTAGVCQNQFTNLGSINLNETSDNNFQGTDNGSFTMILGFDKAGYIFQPSTTGVTVSIDPGGDIQSVTVNSVGFTQVLLTVQFKNVSNDNQAKDDHDQIIIDGLKVSYDNSVAPPARVELKSASTFIIQGITEESTSFGTITAGSVPATPTVGFTASDNSLCLGTNLTIRNATASGGTTYSWYTNSNLTGLLSTATSPTLATLFGTSPVAGTYTRYLTSTNGCESAAVPVVLTITPLPVADAGTDALVCPQTDITLGGSPTLATSSVAGTYTYGWTGPSAYTSALPNPVLTTTTNATSASVVQNYTVTITDANGCVDTDVVAITIKGTGDPITFTSPSQYTFTTTDAPVPLQGSVTGGVFSGQGVVQINPIKFEFDPEIAGEANPIPITYTVTLPNGCTVSTVQNFQVVPPYTVFTNLKDQYCNNEGFVNLDISPSTITAAKDFVNTWNTVYGPLYGYSPIKFSGLVLSYYDAYYGTPTTALVTSTGSTYSPDNYIRYQFNTAAFQDQQDFYPLCPTCNFAYVAIYVEFVNPLLTAPYSIPPGTKGYTFNNGTTAGFLYSGDFVTLNPLPIVNFTGLKSGFVNDSEFCDLNRNYNLVSNRNGGQFGTWDGTTLSNGPSSGIIDAGTGVAVFNPDVNYGASGANPKFVTIRYFLDPGTKGSNNQACSNSQDQFINIYPLAQHNFTGASPANASSFCYEGGKVLLDTDKSNTVNERVTWSGFGVVDNADATGTAFFAPGLAFDQSNPSATVPQTIALKATYTSPQGCPSDVTRSFDVYPKPVASYTIKDALNNSPADLSFCYTDPTYTLAGNTAPAKSRFVVKYIGLSVPDDIYNAQNTLTFDPSTFYDAAVSKGANNLSDVTIQISYEIKDNINCDATFVQSFTIAPLIDVKINGITDNEVYCSNTPDRLLTFAPAGGSLEVNSQPKSLVNGNQYQFADPDGGINTFQYTYLSGSNNCPNTRTYTVNVVPAPKADFILNPVCDGDVVTLNALPNVNNSSWKWIINGDSIRTGASVSLSFPRLALGATQNSNTVRLVVENSGVPKLCRDSLDLIQTVGAFPDVNFTFTDVCEDDQTNFLVTANIPIAQTEWNFGDGNLLPNSPKDNNIIGADTHGGRTGGKYGSPVHTFVFDPLSRNEFPVELIARTPATVGSCPDTVRRKVGILHKLSFSPSSIYQMKNEGIVAGDGYWIAEDLSTNSSWTFGLPAKSTITAAEKVWVTDLTGSYKPNDNSVVNSPCFDISAYTKPAVAIEYWADTDVKDGANLQVSLDGGATWFTLGATGGGENWYNETSIASEPGGANEGWNGSGLAKGKVGRFSLDGIPANKRDFVRFRVAFASDATRQGDGFAFGNVEITERNRITLVENFTNTGVTNPNNDTNFNTNLTSSEIVKIEYHTGFPAADAINSTNAADHNARAAYYGITPETMPTGFIDGTRVQNFNIGLTLLQNALAVRSLKLSLFNIDISTEPAEENEFTVKATLTKNGVFDAGKLNANFYLAIVEKDVTAGGKDYKFVMRKLLGGASGYKIPSFTGSFDIEPGPWKVTGVSDPSNLAVIAFVQRDSVNEVLQAAGLFAPTNLPTTITSSEGNRGDLIQVYPNPADSRIKVVLPVPAISSTEISLTDALGRKAQIASIAKGQREAVLETTGLASGIYIVEINQPSGVHRKKIFVTHRTE